MNQKTQVRWHLLALMLSMLYLPSFAQGRQVSGIVKDESGETMIGVNVQVKGTSTGTITDLNGQFSIAVLSDKSILVISYVGYVSKEIAVNNQNTVNIILSENSKILDEIVVVGYGAVKKRDITGSVASVSGKDISATPVANAAQALQGKLPGVNVITQDGRPDASVSIRVRGGGSISQSNDPLFVVDGFPVSSIADIPADQIESIDVLKDASSTAIYGARGANGVIIVTTKKAKTGKVSVNYNGYVKFNTPTKYLDIMDAYDYIAYNWGYAEAIGATYSDAWQRLWAIGSYMGTYNNTEGIDHYRKVKAKSFAKEVYKESFSHNHNLNISGGSENTKFLFALSHTDEDGMKVNSWYKRTSASLKLDQKIVKNLNLSVDTRFSNIQRVVNEGVVSGAGSLLSSAYRFRPIATEDVLGELDDRLNTSLGMYDNVLQDRFNPVARIKDYTPLTTNKSLRANGALSWNVIKGLTARSELGLSTYWNNTKTWSGAIYNDYFDAEGNQTYGGNAEISRSEGWNMRWANTLNYNVQGLGEKHSLGILVGQEISDSNSESMKIAGQYYPVSFDADRAFAMMDQYNTEMNTPNHSFSSNKGTPNRMLSFFGRANYSFMDRYLITATFRADGSSKFAPSSQWGYFPAAALAWRISEEDFAKKIVWLDNLKLRLSYGMVGNDGIDASLWKMNWKSSGLLNYSIDENKQPGYEPASATMANPNLKWETTITRNLGLDFGIFNNRLYGTVDLYWNTTKDLLMLTSISSISGFSTTYDNIGQTSNKGLEISLSGDIIRSKDFNLSASMNINFNKGNVDKLAPGVNGLYKTQWGSTMTQPGTGDYILMEGKPVGLVRGYTYDGWYTTSDFTYQDGKYTLKEGVPDIASGILGTVYGTQKEKPGGQSAYPGVVKYKDISGPDGIPDGIVDDYDVSVIGDMNPKHTGGFNLNLNYKHLDLSLGFNWSYGNKIYNASYLAALYGGKENGLYRNGLAILADSYKLYDIQDGNLVRITEPSALDALNKNAKLYLPYHENPVVSTLGIEDGSYLRLNTVSLGYTFAKNLIKKLGLQNARVYGTIYNLLTITGYSGVDPEVNANPNLGGAQYPTTGLDWGTYPRARSYTFGVNVEF